MPRHYSNRVINQTPRSHYLKSSHIYPIQTWMRWSKLSYAPFNRSFILHNKPKSNTNTTMSYTPDTPEKPTASRSGMLTPGMVSEELSKLELPAPTNLRLNLPSFRKPFKGDEEAITFESVTGDIDGPEPEAIVNERRKTRSESMSAELSTALSRMKLPQPERIFGPDEGESEAAREKGKDGKQGVSAEDWDNIGLEDQIPEALKEPTKMTHSRNASRV